MSDDPAHDERVSVSTTDRTSVSTSAISSAYKVLGELTDSSGAGVLGQNNASSGTPIGVEGAVPNASGGYGLYTVDDAGVEGVLDTAETDFIVEAGTTSTEDARNVVLGHAFNDVIDGAVGGTVSGGGFDDGSAARRNTVADNYGTVGGGRENTAGSTDGDPTSAEFATVGGGQLNTASGNWAAVGGGDNNTASVDHATVAGGEDNVASGNGAAVGGGEANSASDSNATVSGGQNNDASAFYTTVAGGEGNLAGALHATVGGGLNNTADTKSGTTVAGGVGNDALNLSATVGGGQNNSAEGDYATISGGESNYINSQNATVGGGKDNQARGAQSTIGGGQENYAPGNTSTIAGGFENDIRERFGTVGGGWLNSVSADFGTIAGGGPSDTTDSTSRINSNNEVYDNYGTVGGGGNNAAGSSGSDQTNAEFATVGGGRGNTASATGATVPGGRDNTADGDYSFAAGRGAFANADGTFVWSDSSSSGFQGAGADQFLIDAAGGVGINTQSPETPLHVEGFDAGANSDPAGHIALVEGTNDDSDNQILALKNGYIGDPGASNNFITFFDGTDDTLGSIEGDGTGGINYTSGSADYAEFMPRADPVEAIEPTDVVGVVDGAVTKRTAEAEQAMVVSGQSIVTGNSPGQDPEAREGYEQVAFVGQVPVRVRGPVETGDLIVPSGEGDGTGDAIAPGAYRPGDGPLVGRAWEGDTDGGVSEVTVAVGLETGEALAEPLARHRKRIDELEAENEELRERVAGIEREVGLTADATGAPADD